MNFGELFQLYMAVSMALSAAKAIPVGQTQTLPIPQVEFALYGYHFGISALPITKIK